MKLEKKWVLAVWVDVELRMSCSFRSPVGLMGFVARDLLVSRFVLAATGSQSAA